MLAKMCGSMVFPPKEHANLSKALSAAILLLQITDIKFSKRFEYYFVIYYCT